LDTLALNRGNAPAVFSSTTSSPWHHLDYGAGGRPVNSSWQNQICLCML